MDISCEDSYHLSPLAEEVSNKFEQTYKAILYSDLCILDTRDLASNKCESPKKCIHSNMFPISTNN